IYLYDDNKISIDGSTDLTFTEDVLARFTAYGWQALAVDGHDPEAIAAAIAEAQADEGRPTLIACRTIIAHGSPGKAGTSGAHGAPLGAAEVAATKAAMGWPESPAFHVPEALREAAAAAQEALGARRRAWEAAMEAYREVHPDLHRELQGLAAGELPQAAADAIPSFAPGASMATRKAVAKILGAVT